MAGSDGEGREPGASAATEVSHSVPQLGPPPPTVEEDSAQGDSRQAGTPGRASDPAATSEEQAASSPAHTAIQIDSGGNPFAGGPQRTQSGNPFASGPLHPLSNPTSPSRGSPPTSPARSTAPDDSLRVQPRVQSVAGSAMAEPECRICLQGASAGELVSPCACSGSCQYAHLNCVQTWAREKASTTCEICGKEYKEEMGIGQIVEEALALRRRERSAMSVAMQQLANEPHPMRYWCHHARCFLVSVIVFIAVIIALYVVLFVSGKSNTPTGWLTIMLRVAAFALPIYLVLRAIIAWRAYRSERTVVRSPV